LVIKKVSDVEGLAFIDWRVLQGNEAPLSLAILTAAGQKK
jgi:hypothetical protein